jgi:hypothetical protein
MFTLESCGPDRDEDGLPDALAAPLGALLKQDGLRLLIIRRTQGTILVTTPFTELLQVEGAPVPQTELPAEWRLGQKNK